MGQSYQQVSGVIAEDLKKLKEEGIETLKQINPQEYFFKKKQENPKKYERLRFNTNRGEPFSEDLENILMDFRICGILETKYDVIK